MKTLTARQSEILKLIQEFVEDTGFPPTRSDIAKALHFKSVNAAEEHLKAIEKKRTYQTYKRCIKRHSTHQKSRITPHWSRCCWPTDTLRRAYPQSHPNRAGSIQA